MQDTVQELQAEIEQGVTRLVDGEDWRRWLQVAARFPHYSFRNTLLIRLQRPDATAVMGYRAWQALGHQVRKGERSISILAPVTYKRATAEDHVTSTRWGSRRKVAVSAGFPPRPRLRHLPDRRRHHPPARPSCPARG